MNYFSFLGHFDLSISTLNLSQGTMTDDRLQQLLSNVPEESIILLEDIDAATVGRHYEKEGLQLIIQKLNFYFYFRCYTISRHETINIKWFIKCT
jgi:hypothetical protein